VPRPLALLAHAGAADESLAMAMVVASLWIGWVLLVASAIVPRAVLGPSTPSPAAGPRPSSTATLRVVEPAPGTLVRGDRLRVVLALEGGRIVESATTELRPDTGHVHVVVDGRMVSMTYGTLQIVDLSGLTPGRHELEAEFVAADHAPFAPRVLARTWFRLEEG
jgi:hypothetical protein